MRRVLLDENVPAGVARFLLEHNVDSVQNLGWASLKDDGLIEAAEKMGFEVIVTCDQSIRFQQNLSGRRFCWVLLKTNSWKSIRTNPGLVLSAVNDAEPGNWIELTFPRSRRII